MVLLRETEVCQGTELIRNRKILTMHIMCTRRRHPVHGSSTRSNKKYAKPETLYGDLLLCFCVL